MSKASETAEKGNPYVRSGFCDERHKGLERLVENKFSNVMDKLRSIEGKVDIMSVEKKEEKRDWWDLAKKVFAGLLIAFFTFIMTRLG